MRIILVGASGTIGTAVKAELDHRHDVITAGRNSGDLYLDITDTDSIHTAFTKAGKFDAVISCAGHTKWAPFTQMTTADYEVGLKDKLMGQVNLVLIGREYINQGGSFTLSTGVTDHDPIPMASSASMVATALNGFVMAAAIEMPRGIRLNAVSPGVIEEAMEKYAPYFRGHNPVPAAKAALGYAKSVEGLQTGQTFRILS
ncbi:short chain dehydrogenase [Marinomonas sp. MED121]|uniref:short chain dehydrogenase n=1 Tax=Marinomonas sp. MED121 TaxID=314277 RepID=UPI000069117F|nr:short chain dehydrogenase [Marinomonas sp. MED121]EAQ67655.1 short chain dehydrogenase [Marinomonas sp. MED121]